MNAHEKGLKLVLSLIGLSIIFEEKTQPHKQLATRTRTIRTQVSKSHPDDVDCVLASASKCNLKHWTFHEQSESRSKIVLLNRTVKLSITGNNKTGEIIRSNSYYTVGHRPWACTSQKFSFDAYLAVEMSFGQAAYRSSSGYRVRAGKKSTAGKKRTPISLVFESRASM